MNQFAKVLKLNLLLSLFLLFILSGCVKKEEPSDWLAKVDNRFITTHEFRMFYELDPNFGIDSTGLPALNAELQKMIDQVLALNKAQREGLVNDPAIGRAFRWEEKQAMLRALYREIISGQIKISEDDLREAYMKKNEMVHVRHLFTKDRATAEKWYENLKKGKTDFKELAAQAFKDTSLAKNGGDLGWIKLSELDDDFVNGLDTLRPGQISHPVKTRWGYHIIQMINRKRPAIIRESDFDKQRPALIKWIRRQRGLELSREFIKKTIGELNPQPDAKLFLKLWIVLKKDQNLEKLNLPQPVVLDNYYLDRIESALRNDLDKPFIRFKGGSISLKEFLDGMRKAPTSHRPRFKTPKELSLQIATWFRDEFLFQKAKKRKLDRDPQVKKEVRRFKEQEIYYYYVNQIVDTMKAPEDVESYFKNKEYSVLKNRPELAHFQTLQEWKWDRAEKLLHESLRKQPLKIEVRIDSLKNENKRIDWKGRIRFFMIRKPS